MQPWAIILTSWDGPAWRSGVRPTFLHFPGTDTALFKALPISVLVRATCEERASRMMRLSALHTRIVAMGREWRGSAADMVGPKFVTPPTFAGIVLYGQNDLISGRTRAV